MSYLRKRRITPLPSPRAAKVNIAISPPPLLVPELPLLVEPVLPEEPLLLVEPLVPELPLLLGLPMLPLLFEPELEPVLLPDCPDVLPLWSVDEPVVPPVCPLVLDPLCGDALEPLC